MVKLGKHLTKRIAKKPVAKKPKLTCTLDDITFNNCEKLKRYKKLKEHPYFQEVIDENTVRCMCNKEIKLDKTYHVHNLDNYSKNKWCKFTAQP
ncbi:hypothetical protein RirG_098170 [Rhizophagus irregularis DAOM 197198w]|uniref:Uncharacterized protein n=1 Tax=Rhizophagus irregularis (strain DAOM 197198w) TaxID=1432141 RepID=A0A015L9L3_RHIIW|nr:hypothetical protein RirG_098170 [Rhizophagus irregularis DAOM 197198w]